MEMDKPFDTASTEGPAAQFMYKNTAGTRDTLNKLAVKAYETFS